MNAIIIKKEDWNRLPTNIINKIIEVAKKDYGVKFISRETGKEYEEIALIGLFGRFIETALEEVNF